MIYPVLRHAWRWVATPGLPEHRPLVGPDVQEARWAAPYRQAAAAALGGSGGARGFCCWPCRLRCSLWLSPTYWPISNGRGRWPGGRWALGAAGAAIALYLAFPCRD